MPHSQRFRPVSMTSRDHNFNPAFNARPRWQGRLRVSLPKK
jgi:hypothetical protein